MFGTCRYFEVPSAQMSRSLVQTADVEDKSLFKKVSNAFSLKKTNNKAKLYNSVALHDNVWF